MTAIRLAEAGDAPRLRQCLGDYLAELGVGRGYAAFDAYFEARPGAERRWPYLIVSGETWLGFAFVQRIGRPDQLEMAEFCILPGARRQGHGQRAVAAVLARHPGRWRLGVLPGNDRAAAFWPEALKRAGAQGIVWQGSWLSFRNM